MSQTTIARFEIPIALGIAAASAAWAAYGQAYQVFRLWDSDEYFLMAQQLAAGDQVTAAVPYAYRLLTPGLVAACCAGDIQRGFLAINLVSGVALAVLLIYWLRHFISHAGLRVLMVAAYALQWHAPIRFVFYYPAYVDPMFQLFMVAALIAAEHLAGRSAASAGIAYTLLVAVGTLAREIMLILPAAALVAVAFSRTPEAMRRARWAAVAMAAGVLVSIGARAMVNPRPGYRFLDAIALHLGNKPIESLLLMWFLTFGPMIAVVIYDWRATRAFLRERADLAALLGLFVGLAYVGGHDTERYFFWAMPVVYLLIAQSMERQYRLVSGAAVATVLLAGQLLAQRVLWAVPDPESQVTALAAVEGLARWYAIANRVFVIDDFHWNLWSNFGSRPFHLVQLALYLGVAMAIVALMRRRAPGPALS